MTKRILTFLSILFVWIPAYAGMTGIDKNHTPGVSSMALSVVNAQTPRDEGLFADEPEIELEVLQASESAESTSSAVVVEIAQTPQPRVNITQPSEEAIGPLEELLNGQKIELVFPFNIIKSAIRNSVEAGVPPNTIVLLLLLPLVIAVIAAARHVVGLRGFGIFLPAALAIVFVATGPIIGIILFMIIVLISTYARVILRKTKIKLQYLPRMSIILWFVVVGVLGILFLAPVIKHPDFTSVSIFPVLILVLLAEDFSKVQLGKSPRTAIALATETIVMALVSYIFLTIESLQQFALLNPEILLISVLLLNIILGKYVGLRFLEYWRFRKLILKSK